MGTSELRQTKHALDWLEPVEAYQRLRSLGPLMLDGMGDHPEASHGYIALSGRLDATFDGHAWTVEHEGGNREVLDGPPVNGLRSLLESWKFDSLEEGFTGGFVGYFAYEFTPAVEPTLPSPRGPGPHAHLRLCRDAVVFDRKSKQAWLWTTDLPGEAAASKRAMQIQGLLAAPAPMPAMAAPPTHWSTSLDQQEFCQAVDVMREHIRTGDLFQANIATEFRASWQSDPVAVFAAVQRTNPSPFMALMEWPEISFASNSPELLFAVEDGRIRARPIAGTRPRNRDATIDAALEQELLTDPKEQAEHTMLVDLIRNDIARVSQPGTVRVTERGSVERYQRVMHLVSSVEGHVAPNTDFVDWLAALFPGGTITGAPKHRACLRIHEAETVPRGPYTGSAGFLSWDQQSTLWNIMIRTMAFNGAEAWVHAGSGIVAGSQPAREWDEAGHKAQALLETAARVNDAAMPRVGEVSRHGEWTPSRPHAQVEARVLLVDNYDSFVHNLADYCESAGADVLVVRNDTDVDAALASFQPTHVILSPGPGWPDQAGATMALAAALPGQIPVLGVCLGHQALAQAAGGTVTIASRPVHGETDQVHVLGGRLLDGFGESFEATRYHSLVVEESTLPPEWHVTARLEDGTVMAMEHMEHSAFGLQFHPESIGTRPGLDILIRFLQTQ